MEDIISYVKTEVTEVADDHAMIKTTLMDKDKEPMAGMEPTETKIEFQIAEPGEGEKAPEVKTTEETITVEAGEFACTVIETGGSKIWMSKDHPGLMVKLEHAYGTAELVEFTKGK
jgi:hypothetical protein